MKRTELLALADALQKTAPTGRTRKEAAAILRQIAEAQPVAWRREVRGAGVHGFQETAWRYYGITASKEEADAHVARCVDGIEGRSLPLYLAPPAREPLTDEQIVEAFDKSLNATQFREAFAYGVTFAERHHGIRSEK